MRTAHRDEVRVGVGPDAVNCDLVVDVADETTLHDVLLALQLVSATDRVQCRTFLSSQVVLSPRGCTWKYLRWRQQTLRCDLQRHAYSSRSSPRATPIQQLELAWL